MGLVDARARTQCASAGLSAGGTGVAGRSRDLPAFAMVVPAYVAIALAVAR